MSDIAALTIGLSGLDADQQALNLVGQNITNANTPGYVDEEPELQALSTTTAAGAAPGSAAAGDGVSVAGVDRLADTNLQSQMLDAQSSGQSLTAVQSALSTIQSEFPEPASSGALSTELTSYWSDWSSVATNPGDPSARSVLLDQGATVAASLQQASSGIAAVATAASQQLASTVTSINGLTGQIASLNQAIVRSASGGQPDPGLEDQRDALVSQLSDQIGIRVSPQADGSETIYAGNGALVSGDTSQALQVTTSGGTTSLTWQADGGQVAAGGGTAGGLLTVLNATVPSYQSGLDGVASSLIQSVNQAQSQGVDLTGATGQPFFSGTGASDIAVALTDPDQVAAASASSPTPTNPADNLDGSNAAAIADLGTTATVTIGSGPSASTVDGPDAAYTNFVSGLGSATALVNQQVTAQSQVTSTATSTYQAQTGVDTNQELTEMVQYQNAYEAAARYVSTIDATMQDFLQTVG